MKISTVRSLAATLVAVVVASAGVLGVTDRPTTSAPGFSASFLTAFPEYERFRSDDYQRLLAGDGLRSLDPQVLYQLVAEAAKRNEPYKALYLARLFTQLRPEVASGWTNRARLATALGFEGEAAASGSRATGTETPVPPSALPGALTVRPATLHDGAAALALVSDDVAAMQGPKADTSNDVLPMLDRLDQALADLAISDPRAAQIVQLRYMAGLTVDEIAQELGLSAATVKRDWTFAKAWLAAAIEPTEPA